MEEWDSVGDNEAADVHGLQLPANAIGVTAGCERPDTHAVPNAFVAELGAAPGLVALNSVPYHHGRLQNGGADGYIVYVQAR